MPLTVNVSLKSLVHAKCGLPWKVYLLSGRKSMLQEGGEGCGAVIGTRVLVLQTLFIIPDQPKHFQEINTYSYVYFMYSEFES